MSSQWVSHPVHLQEPWLKSGCSFGSSPPEALPRDEGGGGGEVGVTSKSLDLLFGVLGALLMSMGLLLEDSLLLFSLPQFPGRSSSLVFLGKFGN